MSESYEADLVACEDPEILQLKPPEEAGPQELQLQLFNIPSKFAETCIK